MAVARNAQFLKSAREHEILDAAQLAELEKSPLAQGDDLPALGRLILQKGWLTRFQIILVAQGKARDLALGPYRLLDRLGEGGMGQVFKAFHKPMGRTVALKVIRKEKLASQQAVQRFFREVQAAARLVHPNIVVAFDANQINGTHYFAMEYVEGSDLAKLVKGSGPLPVQAACEYIRQAALGLQHAHGQGMVHRDIKPHNLLVTQVSDTSLTANPQIKAGPRAVVKILDMGLARLSSGPDGSLTQDGAVIGTPEYIPPEQARDSRAADARADLYSLGCTFFFLLTGRPPFQGGTLAELLLKHQMDAPPDVRQLRPDAPADVAAIVARLLSKQPEARFQTAQESAQVLEPICQGGSNPLVLPRAAEPDVFSDLSGGSIDSPSGATVVQARLARGTSGRMRKAQPAGWNKGLLAGMAVAALALIGLILFLVFPKGQGDNTVAVNPATEPGASPTGRVEPPAVAAFSLASLAPVNLKGGETRLLPIKVERQGAAGDPIQIRLQGLPPEVRSDFATIERDQDTGQIRLVVQPNAPDLEKDVQVVATCGTAEKTATFKLMVQGQVAIAPPPPPPPPPPGGKNEREIRLIQTSNLPGGAGFCLGGQQIAVAVDDRLRILNAETGQEVRSMTASSHIRGLAIAPDGRHALSISSNRTAEFWDLEKGQQLQQVQNPMMPDVVDLSPDARHGVIAGGTTKDGFLAVVWDLQTGKEVCRYNGHPTTIRQAAIAPDGRSVLSGHLGTLALWELTSGREIRVNRDAGVRLLTDDSLMRLVFAPDGRVFFTGHQKGLIRVWDTATLQPTRQIPGHEGHVLALAVSPDGRYLLSGSAGLKRDAKTDQTIAFDCTVRLWEVATGQEIKRFTGHEGVLRTVAFSPDGRRGLSVGGDRTVRLWDLSLQPPVPPPPPPDQLARNEIRRIAADQVTAYALAYCPDGRRALAGFRDGTIRLYDLDTGRELRSYAAEKFISALSLSADGKRFLAGTLGGIAILFDVETGEKVQQFQCGSGVRCNALTADGRWALTACSVAQGQGTDYLVRVWDLQTGQQVSQYDRHKVWFSSLAVTPDGRTAVSCSEDGDCNIWEVSTGRHIQQLAPKNSGVWSVAVTPDAQQILTGDRSSPCKVQVWDLAKAQALRAFNDRGQRVYALAVSPDGRHVLSAGGGDGPTGSEGIRHIVLWELATGREVRRLSAHEGSINTVAFSPDGTRALSASTDNTIRLWDLGLPPVVAVKPPVEPPMPAPAKKLDPPDAAKQAEALKQIRDLYKDEYARTKAADRRALAARLLETAAGTKDDIEVRYMLLREAADLAAASGNGEGAVQAIDQLAEEFVVDELGQKVQALTAASKATVLAPDQKAIAEAALAITGDCVDADQYEPALQLTALAETAARKIANVPLITRISERSRDLREMQKQFEISKTAVATLKDKPDDPAANLTQGRYLALWKEDWDAGLPFLARGDDAAFQRAARKELANPDTAEAQAEAGDAWWDLAEKESGAVKRALQRRAYSWYRQAYPSLNGLSQTRVGTRLEQLKTALGKEIEDPWIVIFRSADPSIWNQNVNKGKDHFAIPIAGLPDDIQFLRLAWPKKKDHVFVEVTKIGLLQRADNGSYGWQGTNWFEWNARQLGIYCKQWDKQMKGLIYVVAGGGTGNQGWGFGVRGYIDDRQGYTWAGKEIGPTVFEIAVKSGPLLPSETKRLLK